MLTDLEWLRSVFAPSEFSVLCTLCRLCPEAFSRIGTAGLDCTSSGKASAEMCHGVCDVLRRACGERREMMRRYDRLWQIMNTLRLLGGWFRSLRLRSNLLLHRWIVGWFHDVPWMVLTWNFQETCVCCVLVASGRAGWVGRWMQRCFQLCAECTSTSSCSRQKTVQRL